MNSIQSGAFLTLTLAIGTLAACGGSTETTTSSTAGSTGSSGATTSTAGSGGVGGSGGGGGGVGGSGTGESSVSATGTGGAGGGGGTGGAGGGANTNVVKFRYAPGWSGVTAVSVIGAFGQATDWDPQQPFAKLHKNVNGAWVGSGKLPAGAYSYLFRVIGDDAATNAATFARYAINGASSDFIACPAESPTFNASVANPCSTVTAPQAAADPAYHLTGKVTYDGVGIAGYLVQLDRVETGAHHFFENRTVTAADGTFDLISASAKVRFDVLHPTFLNMNDAQRDPVALAALRRSMSSSLQVAADVLVNPVEMAYHDYAKNLPVGTAALPTTFKISVVAPAVKARVDVYGSKMAVFKSIGDAWDTSPLGVKANVVFDGVFGTAAAAEPMVVLGEKYFWGTSQQGPAAPAGGVQWTGQSMVLPIVWQ